MVRGVSGSGVRVEGSGFRETKGFRVWERPETPEPYLGNPEP